MAADEAVAIETRAAPPAVSGANQTGVRLYNERLVLSLMRRHRQLSKIEVARQTGLSVQTASAILNHLHEDGLLRRETPLRGGADAGLAEPRRQWAPPGRMSIIQSD